MFVQWRPLLGSCTIYDSRSTDPFHYSRSRLLRVHRRVQIRGAGRCQHLGLGLDTEQSRKRSVSTVSVISLRMEASRMQRKAWNMTPPIEILSSTQKLSKHVVPSLRLRHMRFTRLAPGWTYDGHWRHGLMLEPRNRLGTATCRS